MERNDRKTADQVRMGRHKLSSLVKIMLKIGAIGFGGGTALIPVIENEVVEQSHLVPEEEYNKHVMIASITPGALPVEIASGIGRRTAGNCGMIAAATAMALPGAFFTLLFLILFSGMSNVLRIQIGFLSAAVSIIILVMLLQYVRGTFKQARNKKERLLYLFLLLCIFLLTGLPNIYEVLGIPGEPPFSFSTSQILITAFLIILVVLIYAEHRHPDQKNQEKKSFPVKNLLRSLLWWTMFTLLLSLPAIFLLPNTTGFLRRGVFSSILSFGGGDAYLSVAHGLFVDSKMISNTEFYGNIVTVANALPGSILCKVLTGIGYTLGYNLNHSVLEGVLMGISGFACSVAASGTIVTIVAFFYEKYENLRVFASIQRFIRPIISGLLLNVGLTLYLTGIRLPLQAGTPELPTIAVALLLDLGILHMLRRSKRKNNKG